MVKILLETSMFVAGFIGFVLDNTIPGKFSKFLLFLHENSNCQTDHKLSRHAGGAGPRRVGGPVCQGLWHLGRILLRHSLRHGSHTKVGVLHHLVRPRGWENAFFWSFILRFNIRKMHSQISTVSSYQRLNLAQQYVQGDHSGCSKPPVDSKTKVVF